MKWVKIITSVQINLALSPPFGNSTYFPRKFFLHAFGDFGFSIIISVTAFEMQKPPKEQWFRVYSEIRFPPFPLLLCFDRS
jgi:hypothetical protein